MAQKPTVTAANARIGSRAIIRIRANVLNAGGIEQL
jgi:hypothetical protein